MKTLNPFKPVRMSLNQLERAIKLINDHLSPGYGEVKVVLARLSIHRYVTIGHGLVLTLSLDGEPSLSTQRSNGYA